jgi:hypothetical protein
MQFIQGETGDVGNCSVHMDSAVARGNAAGGRGGGLLLAIYGFGGATNSSISLLHAAATNNSAAGEGGGVMALVSGSVLVDTGLAVEIVGADVQLDNVTAAGNSAGATLVAGQDACTVHCVLVFPRARDHGFVYLLDSW